MQFIQNGFVLWIMIGATWGYLAPEMSTAGKPWIPEALSGIMLGMGLTLTWQDLDNLRRSGKTLLFGVTLQYLIMPLSAWFLVEAFGLPKLLALGVILVGACPGGTASNVVTYLARGDVALSVGMTMVSTFLSPILTPLWIWVLATMWLAIDPFPLIWTVMKIVFFPVMLGIIIRRYWQPHEWFFEGFLPIVSMAIIAWIVGVIVGLNHNQLDVAGILVFVVIIHNAIGLGFGYWGIRLNPATTIQRRTVAIEVGMQNSGLAVALALEHFEPMVAIPGAIFSIWHNITGPLLASFWRRKKNKASCFSNENLHPE